jgi:flagellar basal-body rod protein FlgB
MIAEILSNPTIRMLEQTVSFTEQRHAVLVSDIANADVPGYVQRDLSVADFQEALRSAVKRERESLNDAYEPTDEGSVSFESGGSQVKAEALEMPTSVPFHDRGVRSMEYIMSQMADNAMAHNVAAQLLRGKYDQMAKAISMKV